MCNAAGVVWTVGPEHEVILVRTRSREQIQCRSRFEFHCFARRLESANSPCCKLVGNRYAAMRRQSIGRCGPSGVRSTSALRPSVVPQDSLIGDGDTMTLMRSHSCRAERRAGRLVGHPHVPGRCLGSDPIQVPEATRSDWKPCSASVEPACRCHPACDCHSTTRPRSVHLIVRVDEADRAFYDVGQGWRFGVAGGCLH